MKPQTILILLLVVILNFHGDRLRILEGKPVTNVDIICNIIAIILLIVIAFAIISNGLKWVVNHIRGK